MSFSGAALPPGADPIAQAWNQAFPDLFTPASEARADLVAHFIAALAPRLGVAPIEVSADEMRYLQQYDWPGNVRELRNLIERSLILGALNVSALYQGLSRMEAGIRAGSAERPTDLHALEKQHILAILDSVGGDKTRAAQLLGISRRTLERRVAEWGSSEPSLRATRTA